MQTNLKQVLQAHSDTLRDIRGFWRELCSKKITFASLSEVRTVLYAPALAPCKLYLVLLQLQV